MVTTIGQVLVNQALPEEFRGSDRVMDKTETDKLLGEIAHKYPERYSEISHRLVELGRNAAFDEGVTLRLSDIHSPIDTRPILQGLRRQEAAIRRDRTTTQSDKDDAIETLYGETQQEIQKLTMEASLAAQNPFALQVKAKSRGNPSQLAAMLSTPGTYQDAKDRTIPVFINRSYAQGLDPHEYWAATYGARKGVLASKYSTRRAGYLGKLLGMAVMDSVVSEADCDTPYGIPVPASDRDNIGSVLARPVSGFPAGTVIDHNVMSKFQKDKADQIVVRSPITCGTHKGMCQQCAGQRESGDFPEIGCHIGLNAASALAEQIAQQMLNTKHTGKKAGGNVTYAGFDVIKNLATVPKTFPDTATVAENAGRVQNIKEAPQGGYHVHVGDQEHYVNPGMALKVKEGDEVEPGDQLSDGIVSPADAVRLKGIGEGRRYFATRMTQAFRETNMGAHRRNAEVLARSVVNHVQINDPDAAGEHLPGDVVTYQNWAYGYKPRATATRVVPQKAIGKYLEEPALHYTVGTQVTKSVANTLQHHGAQDLLVHQDPVGVDPTMISVVDTPEYQDDWMARLSSSYLKTRLLEDVHRGAISNPHGTNPLPGLARGVGFAEPVGKGNPFTY